MHSKLAKFVASVSMFVKGEDKLVAVRQTNQDDKKNKNAPNTSAFTLRTIHGHAVQMRRDNPERAEILRCPRRMKNR